VQSQNFAPMPSYPTPKQKKKPYLFLLLILPILCILGTSFVILFSYRVYQNSPKLVEGRSLHPAAAQQYTLSADQEAVFSQLGSPDSFTITFYQAEFDPEYSGDVRDEIWRYYGAGIAYTFYNGKLEYQDSIPDAPTNFLPAQYNPDQFVGYASLKTVLASTTIRDYFELPLEKELVNHGTLYYAPGLTFGLVKDRLIYVETISMETEGE
jgi:hypothetical protein